MRPKKEECFAHRGLYRCSECKPVAPYPGPWLEQGKRSDSSYIRSVWTTAEQVVDGTSHGVATEACLLGCCCAKCRPAEAALQAMQREDEKRYLKSRVRIDKSVALAAGVTLLGVFLTVSNPPHMGALLLVFGWLLLHVFEVERYQP